MKPGELAAAVKRLSDWVALPDDGFLHNKRMPVDPEPSPDGNLILDIVRPGEEAYVYPASTEYDGPKHLSHFATCRFADAHRRR